MVVRSGPSGNSDRAYIVEGTCDAVPTSLQTLFFRERADVTEGVTPGRYDNSFSSLSSVTKNLKEVSFEALGSHLHLLSNMSVDYDVFGVKLSVELITKWGVVVILATQIYLFVYIRELAVRVTDSDKGWQKAWIGMHRTRLSQIIFVLTITSLPWIAVGTLSAVHLLPNFYEAGKVLTSESVGAFYNYRFRILDYLSVLVSIVISLSSLWSWRKIAAMSARQREPQ